MSAGLLHFSRRLPVGLWLLTLIAAATIAHSQNLPPVLVPEGGAKTNASLAISSADVDVRVLGFVAETRMTLVFRNPLSRPLAGDLYFPLPPGATVSGYALDVNGALVDGVVVDKDKGRQVFEKEARKGVDPGLVEWTRGNHFKTRVFPIPARGTRTVRVSYVSDVLTGPAGSRYQLPLNFKDKLSRFHLRLEVVKALARPVIQSGSLSGLEFGKWRDSYVAETRRTNTALVGDLVIDLPQVEQQRVLVEKASDGQYYFCVNDFPVDPRPAPKKLTLPILSQVTIFWDASGSRGASDHQRELAFLKAWFAAYSRFTLTANLVPFRNTLAPAQRFTVSQGDASALLNAIAKLDYDGGTQMGCLTNYPAPAPGGWYFLFSDGLGNFGRCEPPSFDAPLYAFSADQTLDQPFLEYLARRSGGAFIPLARLTDPQALAAMANRPFAFIGTDAAPDLADLFPQRAAPLAKRFTLVGKLTANEARLVLNYGSGGKSLGHSKFTVSRATAAEGNLLRRLWAQKKLEDLLVFQKQNETEIADLGKQYGLVTPFTSLIVLETLDQYVEHRVLPPASLPTMRAEYARVVEEQGVREKVDKTEKTKQLLALWNQRVQWWNKKFSFPQDFKYREAGEAKRPGLITPLPAGAVMNMVAPADSAAAAAPNVAPASESVGAAARGEVRGFSEDGSMGGERPAPAREPGPGIAIKEWDPKTPYLRALKKARPQEAFTTYLAQRKTFGNSPAFYLDCAEFFRKQKQPDLGIRILSNIAELELENAALLRVLAYRLLQIGQTDLACGLFEQVLKLRPEEPQSFRDFALALAARGQAANNAADCRRALDLLARVVNNR